MNDLIARIQAAVEEKYSEVAECGVELKDVRTAFISLTEKGNEDELEQVFASVFVGEDVKEDALEKLKEVIKASMRAKASLL